MVQTLEVLLHGKPAGHVLNGGHEGWTFAYGDAALTDDKEYPYPISLALPRQPQPHRGDKVHAVFANLLPEGDIRRRLALSLGLSVGNDFAMLARIGGDCHGALSLRQPGMLSELRRPPRKLDDSELRNAVAVLPVHPLLADAEGLRATLPGEFDKLPVRVVDGQVHLLLDEQLSTHILKPARPGLRESVINEAFTMQLAAAFGLQVPPCEILHGQVAVLNVTRFDRVAEDPVQAIHMEDFCQIAGLDPLQKYEREGGLRLVDIARLLRRYSLCPALDLRALSQWAIFDFLVGFGAAHSKQLALLFGDSGPKLAPFYGLWSTHVYPEMNDRMGFSIGGEERPDWLTAGRWIEFARGAGIRPAYLLEQIREAATRLPRLAVDVAEHFQRRNGFAGIIRRINALIDQRARQMLVSLEAERGSA